MHELIELFRGLLRERERSKNARTPPAEMSEEAVLRWQALRRRQRRIETLGSSAFLTMVVLLVMGMYLTVTRSAPPWIERVVLWPQVPLAVATAACVAAARGRSPIWGVIGLAWILGLMFVGVLDRRCRDCNTPTASSSTQCPTCGAPV